MRQPGPLRGQIFFAEVAGGRKPVVVISNNRRNQALDDVLAARITTAEKPDIASIVVIPDGEPVAGRILCDDIFPVPRLALDRSAGAFSRPTMRALDHALAVALSLAD